MHVPCVRCFFRGVRIRISFPVYSLCVCYARVLHCHVCAQFPRVDVLRIFYMYARGFGAVYDVRNIVPCKLVFICAMVAG